jgi:hypothetical protein
MMKWAFARAPHSIPKATSARVTKGVRKKRKDLVRRGLGPLELAGDVDMKVLPLDLGPFIQKAVGFVAFLPHKRYMPESVGSRAINSGNSGRSY